MIKYSFIILHYLNINDTVECIESILKNLKSIDYRIIVVDNFSSNNSGKKLKEIYESEKKVEIILLDKNLGFAKANNIGGEYAIKKYNSDNIIILNNDTTIIQNNFLDLIEEDYQKYKFDLLGPYIYDRNLKPQNPSKESFANLFNLEKRIFSTKLYLLSYRLGLDLLNFKKNILKKQKRKEIDKYDKEKSEKVRALEKNEMLHGSAIIFRKEFYKKMKFFFFPETFLYVEEDILKYFINKNKLKALYDPRIKIFHKEDGSTDMLMKNNLEKNKFILKNTLKSLNILKKLIKSK